MQWVHVILSLRMATLTQATSRLMITIDFEFVGCCFLSSSSLCKAIEFANHNCVCAGASCVDFSTM